MDPSSPDNEAASPTWLAVAAARGVSVDALQIYAECWTLERWLRELLYLELRACHGYNWRAQLEDRRESDRMSAERDGFFYMPSDEISAPLAFLGLNELLKTLDKNWKILEPSLLPKKVWEGKIHEAKAIRNRMAHFRKPHRDDVDRLRQLRHDLEAGARSAILSYTRTFRPDPKTSPIISRIEADPVFGDLCSHADRFYDMAFDLRYSRRPWASAAVAACGTPGILWEAVFYFRSTARRGIPPPADVWQSPQLQGHLPWIVFIVVPGPGEFRVTLPAVDDDCDTTVLVLTAVLKTLLSTTKPGADDDWDRWVADTNQIQDCRLQVHTPFAHYDEDAVSRGIGVLV